MRHTLLILGVLVFLGGCALPLTPSEARATAVAGGCWPYGVEQRPLPTPTGTAQPTPPPYPTCPPAPNTPTLTPQPPTPLPTIPALTPAPPTGGTRTVLDDPAGVVTREGLAWTATREGLPVVAWISFGATPDVYHDGQVWVRSLLPSGMWTPTQSVNVAPVSQTYGGLALATTTDGGIHLLFSTGDPKGDATVWIVTSADGGMTWTLPAAIGATGSVRGAIGMPDGSLAVLVTGPAPLQGAAALWTLRQGTWQSAPVSSLNARFVAFGRSVTPEGQPVLLAALVDDPLTRLVLARRVGDGPWEEQSLPLAQWYGPEAISDPVLTTTTTGEVALAWWSYGSGGVFAMRSADSGATWTPWERIAMHDADGRLSDGTNPIPYGKQPSLVWAASVERFVASWVELDPDATVWPPPDRTFVSSVGTRAIPADATWQEAMTPQRHAEQRDAPLLAQGSGALWGSADGTRAWVVVIETRNQQYRLRIESVNLDELIGLGSS